MNERMDLRTNKKLMTMKKLVDSSYLPLDVLHKIWEDRTLLEFSHMFPHWFQRRILEIRQVLSVNIAGLSGNKEFNSGIYARVFLDDSHQAVICVHKYHTRFIDIQVAVRTFKYLKAIIQDLKIHSHISIINGMDFCVDLPNEFFDNCPKWSETEIKNGISSELDEESYCIDANRGCYGVVCNRRYVPSTWNVTVYPNDLTTTTLSYIKNARRRIDNLISVLHKYNSHINSDVAIGVLPLDDVELKQYKSNLKI